MTTSERISKARNLALGSLFHTAKYVLGYSDLTEKFHKPYCDFLQDLTVHRKQVEEPRGFFKTTVASICFPIWVTMKFPNVRILLANMVFDNSAKNVHIIRGHWQDNEVLQALFPSIVPTNFNKNRWSDSCADVNRTANWGEGTYEAVGVGGSKTGSHYDFVLEDDLVAARKDSLTGMEILPNQEEIQKAIGWHGLAINLLINPKRGYLYNVGTRWGQYDLIRHIADNQKYYKRYVQKAVEVDDEGKILYDEDGNYIPTFPEMFDLDVLKEIRTEQGDYLFSMMYLGMPYNVEDMVFRDEWIKDKEEASVGNVYGGVDSALTKESYSDFSVIGVVVVTEEKDFCLEHMIRGKFNPTQLINKIFEMQELYHPRWFAMEKALHEIVIKHYIQEKNKERTESGKEAVVIKPVKRPKGQNKSMHIRALQPMCMEGKFYLRPWMRAARMEMIEFTGSKTDKHDDILDMLADIFQGMHYPQREVSREYQDPNSVDAIIDELLEKEEMKARDGYYWPGGVFS